MNKSLKIIVPEVPLTKPSTQFSVIRGSVRTWNVSTKQKKQLQWKIKSSLSEEQKNILSLDPTAEIHVKLRYFLPIPKSSCKKEKNLMEWGIIPHLSKPDNDNLTKFYGDVGTGIFWYDDKQITCHVLRKRYSPRPRVEYTIEVVNNMMLTSEAKKILEIFSPDQVSSLIDDVWKIFEVYDTAKELEDIEDPNELNKRLYNTACILSRIARNHSKSLSVIAKNFPDLDIQSHRNKAMGG